MKVKVKFHDLTLDDLKKFAKHAKEIIIDGDRRVVIFTEPDEWLIEELENRGLKHEVV